MTEFKAREFVIDAVTQNRMLELGDIGASVFGNDVDPAAFTALAIQEASRNAIALPTGVHAGQRLTIARMPLLGEGLVLSGRMSERTATERGQLVTFSADLDDGAGASVLRSTESLLLLDVGTPRSKTAGSEEPIRDLADIGEAVFRPEQSVAYCGRGVNPIHFNPEAAASAGFRAPIIGGEQGVRHLTAAIWTAMRPTSLDISIRFLRPIFWDDRCTVVVERKNDRWASVALAKGGKTATEVTIHNYSAADIQDQHR